MPLPVNAIEELRKAVADGAWETFEDVAVSVITIVVVRVEEADVLLVEFGAFRSVEIVDDAFVLTVEPRPARM